MILTCENCSYKTTVESTNQADEEEVKASPCIMCGGKLIERASDKIVRESPFYQPSGKGKFVGMWYDARE